MSELKLETNEQIASYGIGRQMGDHIATQSFEGVELNAVIAGIQQSFAGEELSIEAEKIQEAFNVIQERMQKQAEEAAKEAAKEGTQYLEKNAQREEVIVTDSGLQYEILTAGEEGGANPTRESTVRTHYHGTFIDGKVFDSSYERGQPAEFPVGGVIAGWTEALQLMTKGAKWRLTVPYQLAYGEQGSPGGIPPLATLVFDVELIDIL
ncbi:FKBP-type peptidyl-prolyl cis-trans isomerase [Amphritea balenae]|uniref:Peptidyl-prolyl cis-trans isomerase n=1 Tax=Amphritea balenae TaxID=452629 RepID=A0A3P1SKJ1_9GAMM|nr:FKBP-type peptidyl-prolyl cis-trans isomerase [Amphritea balenae]RRC97567.1 FKBP-type peptidyl-prolyl cis-trans isomerase [Amphritea balenae]GGK74035.1 peptidyl-prolyl cis-trans isomerase [Amphritea balenae]